MSPKAPRIAPAGLRDAVRYALSEGEALARQGRAVVRYVVLGLTARVVLEAGVPSPQRRLLTQAIEKADRSGGSATSASLLEAALRRLLSELGAGDHAWRT